MRKERKTVILNVDDVDAVRDGTTRVLKKAGFKVWEAASGQEALNKAQDMPDLVILNVNLPDISGFEVCKRIKSDPAKRNIPVLYLSATYTGTKKRITDLDYGANGYLVQPVEPDELVAHVRVLLRIKEAEETASWEAKQWHLTFDAANDAICTLDREQKIQHCNKAFSCLLGKESGDITGRHCWELIHGTQEPIPECPITRMKKSLRREYMELAIDRNWFLVTVDPILDEAGVLAGGVHTLHDITERKQAEETLRKSEERFKQITESAGEWIWEVDSDGLYTFSSPVIEKLLGYTPEEIVGKKHFYDLFIPEEREYLKKIALETFARREPFKRLVNPNLHKNGYIVILETSGLPIIDEKGNLRGYRGVDANITERKQVEEALRESEERYRLLFENSPVGIFVYDTRLRFVSCNDQQLTMLRTTRDQIIGLDITTLKDPNAFTIFNLPLEGKCGRYEGPYHTTTSDIDIWISVYTAPLFDGEGRIVGGIGIQEDITERKRAEEFLRRTEENFRRSLEESPLGVRIVTVGGETIYANRAVLDIYGYDNIEELKTTPVVKRYTPESFAEYQIRREKRKRGDDGPSEYDISIVRKDGEVHRLQVFRKEVLWDGERQFQVLYNDITERKWAEEALQQSEEKHRVLIETTDTGYLILDAQGRVIDANKEYIRLSGYGALEEILGRGVVEWTAPYDLERNAAEVKRCVEQGYVRNLEIDYVNRSGQITPIEINATVLGSGDSARIVSLCRDITERRKAEEVLRAERDKLETVTRNVGAGLAIISKDYRTVWANDVIRNIFGETEGKPCYEMYNHHQTICPWCGVRRVFEAREDNVVTESEGYDKDGNRIWSQIIATPIRDESGEITAALEVVIPITDRKKAEEEIKRSHQQLRDLAKRRQQVREESRIMISREIHDELGGGLTGLKMDLAWLLHQVYDAEAGKGRTALTLQRRLVDI